MENKITRRSGDIYGPGTSAGFLRMQRQGIPRPPFRLEDKLARILKTKYQEYVRALILDFIKAAKDSNVIIQDAAPLVHDGDNLDDLIDFFEQMGKELQESQEAVKKNQDRMNLANVASRLEREWFEQLDEDTTPDLGDDIINAIDRTLREDQGNYLGRLMDDANDKMVQIIGNFTIDKKKLFNKNMDHLRELYLDNSIKRIAWEQDSIKRDMLKRIHAYVLGESDTLELHDLTQYAFERGEHMARLFARDQMARFNKALTIGTYLNAGVTKIKWVTCHDARVRKSHKELDGQIFDINNLPPEADDYNCRCGLVPVEWGE